MRRGSLIIILVLTFLSGCATVQQSAYLGNYSRMQPGESIEKFYKNPKLNIKDYKIALIKVDKYLPTNSVVDINKMNDLLENAMRAELKNSGLFEKAVAFSDYKEDNLSKKLICEIAITRLDPGNRTMRWLFGEFGAGHTHIQVEGKFIDYDTKEEMFVFADLRAGAAVFDITGGDPSRYIQEDIFNIVFDLIKELKKL